MITPAADTVINAAHRQKHTELCFSYFIAPERSAASRPRMEQSYSDNMPDRRKMKRHASGPSTSPGRTSPTAISMSGSRYLCSPPRLNGSLHRGDPIIPETGACHIDRLDLNLLSIILSKVDADSDEYFRTVPFVCQSWRMACRVDRLVLVKYGNRVRHADYTRRLFSYWSPQSIDPKEISKPNPGVIDNAVRSVAWRFRNDIKYALVSMISDDGIYFLLRSIRHLKVLAIPESLVTDHLLHNLSIHLRGLTEINISKCSNITDKGIRVLGSSCPFLVKLTRVLEQQPFSYEDGDDEIDTDDSESIAIAETMPTLQHLVLENSRTTYKGIKAIVDGCKCLESIDVSGCLGLLFGSFWQKVHRIGYFDVPNGFRRRPIIMKEFQRYLYPLEQSE